MSAGNPEQMLDAESGQFITIKDSNFTQTTSTTAYENGWTPIRAEEFERLPDWCIDIFQARIKGEITSTSNEDLHELMKKYFASTPAVNEVKIDEADNAKVMEDA